MAREMRAVRYLTEFAIIFLGVSLSFLAEDLREDRRERAAERESIQRLVQDLESNDFAADSLTMRAAVDAGRRILNAAHDGLESVPRDTLSAWLSDARRCVPFAANNAEYLTLVSSGGLTNISDEEFRTLLVQHYELYEALVQVVPYDCNWDYMLPIREHISSRAYLFPNYEVTGSVEAILSNREFRMRLSHSSTVKGLTMMRLRRLAETRVELMRRARELLEDL